MAPSNGHAKTAQAASGQTNENQETQQDGVDMRHLLATIGEYEIIKRMMSEDIARMQQEIVELREEINDNRKGKSSKAV